MKTASRGKAALAAAALAFVVCGGLVAPVAPACAQEPVSMPADSVSLDAPQAPAPAPESVPSTPPPSSEVPSPAASAPVEPEAAPPSPSAPASPDTIRVKSGFFGTSYYYRGKKLKSGEDFRNTYNDVADPEPRRLYDQAARLHKWTYVAGIPGAFMLPGLWGRSNTDRMIGFTGAGLMAGSFVLDAMSNKKKKAAAARFNRGVTGAAPISIGLAPGRRPAEWIRAELRF